MKPPRQPPSLGLDQALADFLASGREVKSAPQGPVHPAPPVRATRSQPAAAERPADRLLTAYQAVLDQEVERRKPRPAERVPLWKKFAGRAVLLLLLGASGYVWFGDPAFLAPPAHPALRAPVTELTGRRQLVALALEIQDFSRNTGRLPKSLDEVGLRVDHVSYTQVPGGLYELRVGIGHRTIRYRSTQSGNAQMDERVEP